MRDRFRVDVRLLAEESEMASLTVHGPTLEDAMGSMMVLFAPHIETGVVVQVLRTGVFCDSCDAYHPATDRLLRMHSDEPCQPVALFDSEKAAN